MLPTFRLMMVAVLAVLLGVAIAGRGLVGAPEAVTRIGEVPMVGRTLVQLSQVPMSQVDRAIVLASAAIDPTLPVDLPAEAATTATTAIAAVSPESRADGTADPAFPGAAADDEAPRLPLVALDEAGAPAVTTRPPSADPLGDLVRAVVPETPLLLPERRRAATGPVRRGAGTAVAALAQKTERSLGTPPAADLSTEDPPTLDLPLADDATTAPVPPVEPEVESAASRSSGVPMPRRDPRKAVAAATSSRLAVAPESGRIVRSETAPRSARPAVRARPRTHARPEARRPVRTVSRPRARDSAPVAAR
ncbi:hypothetical protein, partial [Rhodovulum sp. PH10]|uniref:hypothetical protein n=1 Tax=Rhodovulum sp. PH10 TaxID=1187851 RepID=UPI00058F3ED2